VKISSLFPVLALSLLSITANAHAHLQKTTPADHSVIPTSPPVLELNFSEPARLTALSIQKGEEPKQNLAPLPATAARQISVPLPPLTPGTYLVAWRVISNDGHVMAGAFHFTLSAAAPH
jgi:copper transport protein